MDTNAVYLDWYNADIDIFVPTWLFLFSLSDIYSCTGLTMSM